MQVQYLGANIFNRAMRMIGTRVAWQTDDCGETMRTIAGSVSIAESNNPTPAPAGGIVPEKEQGGRRRCRYSPIPDTGFKFLRKFFSGGMK